MMGLDYKSKRGQIGLYYSGRTVYIKISPIGIHLEKGENVMNLPSTAVKFKEIEEQFKGKHVILGVDDMDLFKRIRKDTEEVRKEAYGTANRINHIYGSCGYQLVILIDRPVDQCEKSAYYAASECCIVNAVRDGMNLVPPMYIIFRQGSTAMDEARGIISHSPQTSVLIISEFVGCSPSLSGAIRINPWDISSVAEAMRSAVSMDDSSRQLRHEKNYSYVQSHDVAYWARSFM
ncbi:hypothetical protein ACET3Z_030649 [Daucus carota]